MNYPKNFTTIILALSLMLSIQIIDAQTMERAVQENSDLQKSYPIHGSDLLRKQEQEVRNYINQHPEVMRPNALRKVNAWGFTVGATKSWYADNLSQTSSSRYLVPSTCRAVGNNCYIFVEDASWGTRVTQQAVDSVRIYFDSKTPANPSKGIYQMDTETFGNPPNVDGDPKVIILLLDIKDGYSGSGGYVEGYFYSYNEMPISLNYPTSNVAEIFFIDTNPLNLSTSQGLNEAISTLAHEFQHMIHFNYDPNEITFVNESFSTFAEVNCGFPIYDPSLYANEPNHYLFDWRDDDMTKVLNDYSRANRFSVYLRDQAGIGVFKNIVASTLQGVAGIDAGLQASSSSFRFNDLLQNWFIANILDDRTIDTKYGYIYPNLPKSVGRTFFNPNVNLTTDTVNNYAVQYLSFKGGSQLKATITTSNPALIIKAVEIGQASKRVLNVTSGAEFSETAFGTTYKEIHFVIMNTDPNTPYSYTYRASGLSNALELKYDITEPTGVLAGADKDTMCVIFNSVQGGKLDSIRVALRRNSSMKCGVWTYTGATPQPTPLGVPLATNLIATGLSTPSFPYPVPWPNWSTIDLRSYNIRTDLPFAVGFILEGDYSTTNFNRVMVTTTPVNAGKTSFGYFSTSTNGPNWYYSTSNTTGDSMFIYLIRAYVSFPSSNSPVITHTPSSDEIVVNNGTANSAIIWASATDINTVTSMYLEYRQVGKNINFTPLPFGQPYSNNTSVQIPGNVFVDNGSAIGVDYRIVATNSLGNSSATQWYSISVRNGAGTIIQPQFTMPTASSYPSTEMQKAYRIFSVPYNLDNKFMNFIPRSLGDHKKDGVAYFNWRLQRIANGMKQDYEEFMNQPVCLPGTGFFLIIREPGTTITLDPNQDPNTVVKAFDMYNTGVQLSGGINGWYLLGTPMNMTIPWDSLVWVGATPVDHAKYTGDGTTSGWDRSVNQLTPWEGLAVKVNPSNATCIVKFRTGQSNGISKQGITAKMIKDATPVIPASPNDWQMNVNAYRADINMCCEGGGFGMRNGANIDHDQFDTYQPPIIGDKTITIGFSGPNGPRLFDMHPLDANGGVWEMKLTTGDVGAKVKLNFSGTLSLSNPLFDAYLVDLDQKMAHNLKDVSSLEINSGNGVRNFQVVVGKKSFIEQNNKGIEIYPTTMKLYANYPNPFNPETIIRYTVPNTLSSYAVTLKIFNVLGQEVATLVNEQQNAGYKEVKWDAHQQSSGIYFYQINVSDGVKTFKDVKKMVLMK